MNKLEIDGFSLTSADALKVVHENVPVALSEKGRQNVAQAREVISKALAAGKPVYGINTGFGRLAEVRIPADHLNELQHNLVLSHACAVGEALVAEAVRAVLLLKANTLAKGFSGVRAEVIELLLELLNRNVLPEIPMQGSVGASGDLAPLAHMALVLIGKGKAWVDGKWVDGGEALQRAGLAPLSLQAKEGLALLNGTHFMTGLGLLNWQGAHRLAVSADLIGAMSTEAVLGTPVAFDERIHAARGYKGQLQSAKRLRNMMRGSEIRASHSNCSRVQDPYSIRCMPQVHGAIADNLAHVESVIATEINAATDNPLVFWQENEILSGGNFHGHPISTAMDLLGIVMAQLANISERRTALMMDSNLSDLPAFLVRESGLNSGFMIAQVTAASLVSENKMLSHPASVDSIPTSANKEDFVSMGAGAAVKGRRIVENAARVLGIELLCACQGIELRAPLKPGPAGKAILNLVRREIPHLQQDRILAGDIEAAAKMISQGQLLRAVDDFMIIEAE